MGNIFYHFIWQPIEWILFGNNNDSISGFVRPVVKYAVMLGILYFLLFGTGLITFEKKKAVTYHPIFNAVNVETTSCDDCFTATTNPNYVFHANPIIR